MKKILSFVLLLLLAGTFVLAGCGKKVDSGIDPNKTQINVYVANGGYGLTWAQQAAERFNAMPENSEYQVMIYPHNYAVSDIETQIGSGASDGHIYFTTTPDIKSMVAKGYLADITSVYDTTLDGESESIRSKMRSSDMYAKTFKGIDDDGIYAVPYGDSFSGLVYDYQLFVDNGWLCTENGKLTPGPDGEEGTYDDGQPLNLTEWQQMIDRIVTSGAYPFIYTSKYLNYCDPVATAAFVQYEGLANYTTFNTYTGDYTSASGSVAITPEEGYKVFQMEGIDVALSFVDEYLVDNSSYVHPKTYTTTSLTHKDAQNYFILGYKADSSNPQAAFLVDGIWWENEAKSIFDNLGKTETDRGFGKREYRYMLLPDFGNDSVTDNQKRVLVGQDTGAAFVVNRENKDEVEMAKKFLAYTCSDQSLREFTVSCGAIRPFDYELSEDEYKGLTPFQKNNWDMYNDTENIDIVRPAIEKMLSPINYMSTKSTSIWYTVIGGQAYTNVVAGLQNNTADAYAQGIVNYYTPSKWAEFYEAAKNYIE